MSEKKETVSPDAATAMRLLLWARDKGIAISELSVGGVRLVVADIALASRNVRLPDERDGQSLYQAYGGALFDRAKEVLDDVIYDDEIDEEPERPPAPERGKAPGRRAPRRR